MADQFDHSKLTNRLNLIKDPLTIIRLSLEALQDQCSDEDLHIIECSINNCDRIVKIIKDIKNDENFKDL